jgi:hypothetical protein
MILSSELSGFYSTLIKPETKQCGPKPKSLF